MIYICLPCLPSCLPVERNRIHGPRYICTTVEICPGSRSSLRVRMSWFASFPPFFSPFFFFFSLFFFLLLNRINKCFVRYIYIESITRSVRIHSSIQTIIHKKSKRRNVVSIRKRKGKGERKRKRKKKLTRNRQESKRRRWSG